MLPLIGLAAGNLLAFMISPILYLDSTYGGKYVTTCCFFSLVDGESRRYAALIERSLDSACFICVIDDWHNDIDHPGCRS